jgi:hypothetical protein
MELIHSSNPKDRVGLHKPPLDLIPPTFEILLAMAFKNGAIKYGPYNWRSEKVSARTYIGAARRHLAAWLDREELSSDSKLHHLAHAAACLAILIDAQATDNLVDDRPPAGPTPRLIEENTDKQQLAKAQAEAAKEAAYLACRDNSLKFNK